MKLHEAMEKLLTQYGRPMKVQEITEKINRNGWYVKRDSSTIEAKQIYARINKYPHLFFCENSIVSLK